MMETIHFYKNWQKNTDPIQVIGICSLCRGLVRVEDCEDVHAILSTVITCPNCGVTVTIPEEIGDE